MSEEDHNACKSEGRIHISYLCRNANQIRPGDSRPLLRSVERSLKSLKAPNPGRFSERNKLLKCNANKTSL